MKNLFIIPNMDKTASLPLAERLFLLSREAGGESFVYTPEKEGDYPLAGEIPESAECIVVLGGDGTVIRGAAAFFERDLPILGINTGKLGFLTGADGEDPETILKKLIAGDYREEKRILLHFSALREGKSLCEGYALNDVTIRSLNPGSALCLSACVNDAPALSFSGDGLILSSPTGSTAYNLSAGGPIVYPSAEVLLATPLNPHSFLSRSIVLPAGARIRVRLSGKRREEAGVYYDGFCCPDLQTGDEVLVTVPEKKVRLLDLRMGNFFDTLRSKITL